jgi:hypothetical protein
MNTLTLPTLLTDLVKFLLLTDKPIARFEPQAVAVLVCAGGTVVAAVCGGSCWALS